ncbi:MAG: hypothetical protein KKF27_20770 [Gammaproteobacteria bacterium]|uniref:Tail protein n=1 Tax=viral metagenome TaxID=1070528 RepID=A0A6M3J890_9ZZZZ|nr:hypothetical protein [Gammaproteobacteria bacterium]MBU2685683.1 hypothetical protein [Gammaproteobacteria bacterium]
MPKAAGMIEVTLINWKELEQKFGRSREFMYIAANQALRRVGSFLVPALKAKTPIGATARLRNYTVYQVLGKTDDMRVEVRQSARSETGFFYGVAVRQGTKPHFPPYRALIPWVMKKLGIATEKEAASVAYLVARKISRVGTRANPYHRHVVEENSFRIRQLITEEVAKMTVRLRP